MLLLIDLVLVHPDRKNIVILGVTDLFHILTARKCQCSFSAQHHVWCFLHDPARHIDWIDDTDNRGNRASFPRCSVHD